MSAESTRKRFGKVFATEPDVVAVAPGRIEFIGNHTDYNGGLVLGAAIDRHVRVAVAERSDRKWNFASDGSREVVTLESGQFEPLSGRSSWVNYPLGVLKELSKLGKPLPDGFDLLVDSDLPAGAGLSSSAALELSSLQAMTALCRYELPLIERVRLARRAENHFVGVPCGILDQGVSGYAREGHLVQIDCAHEAFSLVPFSDRVCFWIFNSNQKHSLVESRYSERFDECRRAFEELKAFYPDAPNLASITPDQLGVVEERVTPVLVQRARHITGEHFRVAKCRELLDSGDLDSVGDLLYQSHRSSSLNFENSTLALDLLVELTRDFSGIYGARLTGGGFGGAILAMTNEHFSEADAQQIVQRYTEQSPDAPQPSYLQLRTSDGARLES